MSSIFQPRKRQLWLYMAPGVLLYSLIVFVPIVIALYYGFFDWSGGPKKNFIGLENYKELLTDNIFWRAFGNNLYLVAACIIGQIGLAFLFAIFLQSRYTLWKGLHRTLMYFPSVLSAVVVGFVWTMVYDYKYGVINVFLRSIGKEAWAQPWLNNENIALFLVAIPLIWQFVGYYLIIILAAFASVDPQIFEMAEIDGATGVKKAWYITLPLIKNILIVCLSICIAGNMKAFDHIYVMTSGGPGNATNVMALYAYKTSFLSHKMGYGSAMSIGILILSLIFVAGSRGLLLRLVSGKKGD